MKGLIVAAPASGAGKTTIAAGLVRLCRRRGLDAVPFKVGPDYIDPGYLTAAAGRPCRNLDTWAMRPETLASALDAEGDLAVVEGAMGLFDGAEGGGGSTADLAALTGWPVLLVADCSGVGQSVAALLAGFAGFRSDIRVAGAILNRVASDRHEAMLRALPTPVPILGCIRRTETIALSSRHLGLVQAGELADIHALVDRMADRLEPFGLTDLADEGHPPGEAGSVLPPLGQRIAVARDAAFSFAYEHVLGAWRRAGAEITHFSPLEDEIPEGDAVYLPGGYPELHAGRLAAAYGFLEALRRHPGWVYGECGGYMVLGEALTDADGNRHRMAGLLPLETSFVEPGRRLGYRRFAARDAIPLGSIFRGHEFRYARVLAEGPGEALFDAEDSMGRPLGPVGLRRGTVCGSFMHIVDRCRDAGSLGTDSSSSGGSMRFREIPDL